MATATEETLTTLNANIVLLLARNPALVGGAVPVTGTVTATVDESTLATSAAQTTGNNSLASIAAANVAVAVTPLTQVAASSKTVLGAGTPKMGVMLQAPTANTDSVFVGDTNVTSTLFIVELASGERAFLPCSNVATLYMLPKSGTQAVNPSLVG